jgi:hypothetical protein
MASQHKHKARQIRGVPQEDWDDFGVLAGDKNRSPVVARFIAWYLGREGAALPEPPDGPPS